MYNGYINFAKQNNYNIILIFIDLETKEDFPYYCTSKDNIKHIIKKLTISEAKNKFVEIIEL